MTSGFGNGNCWYDGTPASSPYEHTFTCENTGVIQAGLSNNIAFQFSISNSGK